MNFYQLFSRSKKTAGVLSALDKKIDAVASEEKQLKLLAEQNEKQIKQFRNSQVKPENKDQVQSKRKFR